MSVVFDFWGDGVLGANTDFADSNVDGENVLFELNVDGENVVLLGIDGENVVLFGVIDDLAVWNDPAESFFSSKFWGNDLKKQKHIWKLIRLLN